MGLLQKAVETFEAHANLAGKVEEGRAPLAPIGHTITSADIEITLNGNGAFTSAVMLDKNEAKIIIPVTENSQGRTSAPAPHPLCEQIGYLSGQDQKKLNLYLEQLEAWSNSAFSHPILPIVLKYVRGLTIMDDLAACGINKIDDKQLVRWRVEGIGVESGPCWTNPSLFKKFSEWYENAIREKGGEEGLCMISGEKDIIAKQHPKGVIAMNGNAKLISANDSTNFTYRGRFTDDRQAATVSYVASQKAHCALRWLAAEQGVVVGGRTFICWNPQGKEVPRANLPFLTTFTKCVNPTDYKRELWKTLNGWQVKLPPTSGVVVTAFDAATTGRLAVTYYNELLASDFLQRLYDWDSTCCWWDWDFEGKCYTIQTQRLKQIIDCAFGTQRVEKGRTRFSTDDGVMKQQMQRLIACRVEKAQFPVDIERLLVNRASTPQAFEKNLYRNLLTVACAVIRKYHHDHMKEDILMSLEKERADRSYQFGRLLAVFEKVERDTYARDENRETSAIRLQSVFCQRPLHTAKIIESQLERAYFPRLQPGQRAFYKKLIGEIIEQICQSPENEINRPLGDMYLIGYYLQRNELYKSKNEKIKEEADE